jgi:hypothetical protein
MKFSKSAIERVKTAGCNLLLDAVSSYLLIGNSIRSSSMMKNLEGIKSKSRRLQKTLFVRQVRREKTTRELEKMNEITTNDVQEHGVLSLQYLTSRCLK